MHEGVGKESQLVVRKSYKSRSTNLKMLNKFLTVVKLGNKNREKSLAGKIIITNLFSKIKLSKLATVYSVRLIWDNIKQQSV